IRIPKWLTGLIGIPLVQGILGIVYVARLGSEVSHVQEKVTMEVGYLKNSITEVKDALREGTRLRYTSEDATKDKQLMLELIKQINVRIDLSEKRLERLEQQNHGP
ncbi:MAG: hypothetical protein ACWGQW_08875, partial [bacterium]